MPIGGPMCYAPLGAQPQYYTPDGGYVLPPYMPVSQASPLTMMQHMVPMPPQGTPPPQHIEQLQPVNVPVSAGSSNGGDDSLSGVLTTAMLGDEQYNWHT